MKQELTEICAWKMIANKEVHAEGNLKNCKLLCHGYLTGCEHYVPKSLLYTITNETTNMPSL